VPPSTALETASPWRVFQATAAPTTHQSFVVDYVGGRDRMCLEECPRATLAVNPDCLEKKKAARRSGLNSKKSGMREDSSE